MSQFPCRITVRRCYQAYGGITNNSGVILCVELGEYGNMARFFRKCQLLIGHSRLKKEKKREIVDCLKRMQDILGKSEKEVVV